MKIKLKHIVLFVALYTVNIVYSQQIDYVQIQSIYDKLPLAIQQQGQGIIQDFPIVFTKTDGRISDIGLNIVQGLEEPVLSSFINRKFLELALAKDYREISLTLDHSKSRLLYNGMDYQTGTPWNISDGFNLLRRKKEISVRRDSLRYLITWSDGVDNLALMFPANIQILTSKDKKELEQELESVLLFSYPDVISREISNDENLSEVDHIYLLNNGYLFIKDMTNSTFFQKQSDGSYSVIYTPNQLEASFNNLFQEPLQHSSKLKIVVEQQLYGKSKKQFAISLSHLLKFIKANGFDAYVGIENMSTESVESTIILHNQNLNYYHMLHIKTTPKELFAEQGGNLAARWYAYIPGDNILSLYEEELKEKNK